MHDETIIRANELHRRVYLCNGRMPLWKKGQGRAIHVSDYIVEHTGQLALTEEQIHENATLPVEHQLKFTDAREIIYPGKNYDGFWTNEKLVEQVSYTLMNVVEQELNLLVLLGEKKQFQFSNGCIPMLWLSSSLISHQHMVPLEKMCWMQKRWMLNLVASNDWCEIPLSQWIIHTLNSAESHKWWSSYPIFHRIIRILIYVARQKGCTMFWRNEG